MLANWVGQTSTTVGTGMITLNGALPGRVSFGATCSSNEVVPYHLVTGSGDREAGAAVYSANTLTRIHIAEQIVSGVALASPLSPLPLAGTTTVYLGSQASTSLPPAIGIVWHGTGVRSVVPQNFATTTASQAITANELLWWPFLIPATTAIDQVRLQVATAGVGVARIAIETYAQQGQVGTRLWESSAIDISTTGTKIETLAAPLTLRAGWYWVGYVATVTHNIRTYNNALISCLGADAAGTPTCATFEALTAGWTVIPQRNHIDFQRRYYAPAIHFRAIA